MRVSGRKTKGPNAALGFSTFSSCQPNKAEKSQPLHQSVFISALFSLMYVTLKGDCTSKYNEENHIERDRKRGCDEARQMLSDLLTFNDLFSKRCNNN